MDWLRSMGREVYGLFVEDGSFATVLVAWMGIACVALRFLRVGHWGGAVLFAGLAFALAENVLRTSRRR